jgi:hypothetical protein
MSPLQAGVGVEFAHEGLACWCGMADKMYFKPTVLWWCMFEY